MNNKIYEELMKKCIALAKKGIGKVEPNPYVGAIVYDEEKQEILSFGYHQKYGQAHAEVNAINNLKESPKNKTLIVNLEPCSHWGKTPPCADLIIKSGIKKVVVGMIDPNPVVQNNGIKKLKEANIEVITGVLEKECKKLNKIFIKNMLTKKPYIMLKTATTTDGKIATKTNKSKWITNELARKEVQKLRCKYQAIMTGSGTILNDNPRLNVRIQNKKNPTRIIFDPNNKIPINTDKINVFKNDGTRIILVNNSNIKTPNYIEKINFIDFNTLFLDLYQKNITSIMLEAGAGLNSILLKEKEIDEINQFIAPKIFGCGLNFVDNFDIDDVDECVKLKDIKIKYFDDNILLNATIDK